MQVLKRAIDFLIFSNIFVSLCAASLSYSTIIILQIKAGFYTSFFVFFSTLSVYNFQRIIVSEKNEAVAFLSNRHKWIIQHQKILAAITAISIIASIFIYLFYFSNKRSIFLMLFPFSLLALWYVADIRKILPFFKSRIRPLRTVPYLKIVLISITWTAMTVWLVAIESGMALLSVSVLLISFERLLFIFAITLPFDIRDMEQDQAMNIKTVPIMLGENKTKQLAYGALILFALLSVLRIILIPANPMIAVALVTSALLTIYIVSLSGSNKSEYYYSGLVESTMLIQFLLLFQMVQK